VEGSAARYPFQHPNDDFVQPGNLYRHVMTDEARDHLIGNIVSHLRDAQKLIQLRQTALFWKADPEYGRRVAEGLGIESGEVDRLATMSQEDGEKATAQ
jgi:catalase